MPQLSLVVSAACPLLICQQGHLSISGDVGGLKCTEWSKTAIAVPPYSPVLQATFSIMQPSNIIWLLYDIVWQLVNDPCDRNPPMFSGASCIAVSADLSQTHWRTKRAWSSQSYLIGVESLKQANDDIIKPSHRAKYKLQSVLVDTSLLTYSGLAKNNLPRT